MRELLKEARALLDRFRDMFNRLNLHHLSELCISLRDRIDSALSAPDESAIEKVRKIREGGIPGHEVSPYYFTLTDAEAAALIEPSVPRAMLEEIWDAGKGVPYTIDPTRARGEDIEYIAAKHGVKVR